MHRTLDLLKFAVVALLSVWGLPAAADQVSVNPVSQEKSPSPYAQSSTHAHADWAGLWIGVEGQFVFITLTGPGAYELEMMGETAEQKDNIRVPARDAQDGLSFERDGKTLLLRAATGEETGLKWLADKKNCLMVQESEGFCR